MVEDEFHLRPVLANVVNGVFALAVGLGNLQQEHCGREPGLCPRLKDHPNFRHLLYQSVRNVAFSRGDAVNKVTYHHDRNA